MLSKLYDFFSGLNRGFWPKNGLKMRNSNRILTHFSVNPVRIAFLLPWKVTLYHIVIRLLGPRNCRLAALHGPKTNLFTKLPNSPKNFVLKATLTGFFGAAFFGSGAELFWRPQTTTNCMNFLGAYLHHPPQCGLYSLVKSGLCWLKVGAL